MHMTTNQSQDLERIISEYATREKRLANSNLYSRSNSATAFMVEQRQREEQLLFRDVNIGSLANKRILEVGCGGGGVLQHYLQCGAVQINLFGVDIIFERVGKYHHWILPACRFLRSVAARFNHVFGLCSRC